MRLSRRELVGTCVEGGGGFTLAPEGWSWCKTMTKVFERFRYNSLVIEYRPTVGTNTSGAITIGVDWSGPEASITPKDRAHVCAMTPCVDGPVWQAMSLRLPSRLLQSRPWFSLVSTSEPQEQAPGALYYQYNTKPTVSLGEIWVTYDIMFQGTRI